jgi:hypothetical protein
MLLATILFRPNVYPHLKILILIYCYVLGKLSFFHELPSDYHIPSSTTNFILRPYQTIILLRKPFPPIKVIKSNGQPIMCV